MERTDLLAGRRGISLRSLGPQLGLSVASLFGYRNGKLPISGKAWSKLERLETVTEIERSHLRRAESEENPMEFRTADQKTQTILREDPTEYKVRKPTESRTETLEERVERLEELVIGLAYLIKSTRVKS